MKAQLVRVIHFSTGHRYCRPELSETENQRIYGSMYMPKGVGHNFKLEICVSGDIDPLTGMIIDLVRLDQILKELSAPLDHHFLNTDVEFFRAQPPTAENIASYCFKELKTKLTVAAPSVELIGVRLYEGDQLWVDVTL